ncbi:DUF4012 domain-containing protein [Streptomyces tailanensis]|uniref:DUF4012 domain-containing protein n=1 Tax=Streptomyces tailanensis TaxID=2569858 RepID=UPI00155A7D9B|nr:DUF4012 domain-containing protein [Streptomyces tailanensis]
MTDQPRPEHLPKRRRRRRLLTGGAGTLLITAFAGWLVVTGFSAQADLEAARRAVDRLHADLQDGHAERPDSQLAEIRRHTAAARSSTSGIAWWLAARLPPTDRAARSARGIAAAADTIAHEVLPELTRAATTLRPAGTLVSGNGVDLAALATAAGPLTDADQKLTRVQAQLTALPKHSGIDRLDRARADLLQQTSRLTDAVGTAATAARLLPPMLGGDGPRRYFLALQTNAEARGTGGLVGAFAILAADHGRLRFEQFSPNNALPNAPKPVIELGPDFDRRYTDAQSTQLLANSNLSPHYPYAARIWTRMWQERTGIRLDGAIATDPVGLAHLLNVTGPVSLSDGRRLTAANAVALTERDLYTDYPDTKARKKALTRIADSVAESLTRRRLHAPGMFKALSTMATDGRLLVWSRHPGEQRLLADTALGGVLPDTSAPYAHLVVNNAAASKLDYYLHRRLDYRLGPCRNGIRKSTVRIRLTNSAPRTGLPDYVVYRGDDPQRTHVHGSNLLWTSLYTTQGAELAEATLNGRQLLMSVDRERKHTVFSTVLEIQPGQTHVLDIRLVEPAGTAPPLTRVQPLALPQTTTVSGKPCADR